MFATWVIGWLKLRTYWMNAWISPMEILPMMEHRHRHHETGQKLGLPAGFAKSVIELLELLDGHLLLIESPDDIVPAIHFFYVPIDVPEVFLLTLEMAL